MPSRFRICSGDYTLRFDRYQLKRDLHLVVFHLEREPHEPQSGPLDGEAAPEVVAVPVAGAGEHRAFEQRVVEGATAVGAPVAVGVKLAADFTAEHVDLGVADN